MRSWHGGGLWFLWCYLVGRIARIARVQALDFISDFGERMILRGYDRHHLLIQLRLGRLQYSASCIAGLVSPLVCLSFNTDAPWSTATTCKYCNAPHFTALLSSFLFNRIAFGIVRFS
jgi:hypothetical protein